MITLIGAALTYELLYSLPAAIRLVPLVIRLRRTATVTRADWSLFVLPTLVWITVALVARREKSIANMAELVALGLAVAIAALARSASIRRGAVSFTAGRLLVGACVLAGVIAVAVPTLPE